MLVYSVFQEVCRFIKWELFNLHQSVSQLFTVVEISFDKVVSHLFSDSMSLVTQKVLSGEILQIWPTRSLKIALSDFFKDFFKVVDQTGDWESGFMVKCAWKNSTVSVAFKMFFFATRIKMFLSAMQLKLCLKQLNRAHAWSYHYAIGHFWLLLMFFPEDTQKLVWLLKLKTAF